MYITDIVPLGKNRSKIYIDGEFAFVLYKGELHKYGIAAGNTISEDIISDIRDVVIPKRAKLRVMNLLKSRPYTEAELRRKLDEGEYPKEAAEAAIAYVAEYGYLDDVLYAADYITAYSGKKTERVINAELMKKGVSKADIEKGWESAASQGVRPDYDAMIEALLKKRHFDKETADIKEKRRTYAFLAGKGFPLELIGRYI